MPDGGEGNRHGDHEPTFPFSVRTIGLWYCLIHNIDPEVTHG